MIDIVECKNKKQMKQFAVFPIKLYKKCPYYVPNLVHDEKHLLDPDKNNMLRDSVVKCFVAYKDNKLAGRICAIISPSANAAYNKKEVRFSRPDFIEDIEVLKKLLKAVALFGKENGMETIAGPWGFDDTDREGLLTYGYNQLSNYVTAYSYPYYARFFDILKFNKQSEWIEYSFDYKHTDTSYFEKVAQMLKEKDEYRELTETLSIKQIIKQYGDSFIDCYNKAYSSLDNFIPFDEKAKERMFKDIGPIINKDYLSVIVNKEDKVIALGVGFPDLGNALRWGRGNFLLCALPLIYFSKFPKCIELALIAVDPEYMNNGLPSLLIDKFVRSFRKNKVRDVWMDPVLTTNLKMQNLWKRTDKDIRQMRQTYVLNIDKFLDGIKE